MKNFIFILFIIFLSGCSGITMITPERKLAENVDTSKMYKQSFLQKMSAVKEKFRQGKVDQAISELNAIKEDDLTEAEKGTKKNLLGVMQFSRKNFDNAAKNFEDASKFSSTDPALDAQVNLNLGSAYYKQNMNEKALAILSQVNYKNLQSSEAKKFHQVYALLAEQLGKKEQSLSALIRSLEDKKAVSEISSDARFIKIQESFNMLTSSERVRLLEEFDQEKNIAVAYLAYLEANKAFSKGDKSQVEDLSDWIKKRYSDNSEIMNLFSGLSARNKNNSSSIDLRYIGIALPLSGDLKGLGERVLSGIDIALEEAGQTSGRKYRLEIKDTAGNAATGAFAVKDLIEVNNVAAVIGGLTTAEATKEYLEAKKYGVLFISLSKVLLPKEEKNHLLIEIPGSIESQVRNLFSEQMAPILGKKPAILYPKTEMGEAYANEFWRQSKVLNLDVTGLISFDPNSGDYKDPVKNLLGIKFTRERSEEMAIVNDIAQLESKKSIKRLQNLQPQVDFDWVFVPALPREVVQLLPNFNYYDAFNLTYVGVPSWRSELMLNEGYRYGNVYFMDEPLPAPESVFNQKFIQKFNKQPNVVETIAYDALKILMNIIESDNDLESREDLDLLLTKTNSFKSESSVFTRIDDIWIKSMPTLKIKREGFESLVQ